MGAMFRHWRLGLNQFRLRLYPLQGFMRTGLADQLGYIPLPYSAFHTMLISPLSFDAR